MTARKRDEGDEPIMFTDNRRIDPVTGKARAAAPAGADTFAAADMAAAGVGEAAADPGNTAGSAISNGIEAAQAEAAERTADLQRLTAEYANYRKRVDRDKQAAFVLGQGKVISELLAICDDLDRAEAHGDLTGGFKNVADKLTGVLEQFGLAQYGAEGDPFDPELHEAVQFATSPDVSEQVVGAVLRAGYLLGEKVLRAAVVAVTGPEDGAAAAAATADTAQADVDTEQAGAAPVEEENSATE